MKQLISSKELGPNMVFGDLTALHFVEYRKMASGRKRSYWLWRCVCGNEKIIQARFVLNGNIKSFGEKTKENQ